MTDPLSLYNMIERLFGVRTTERETDGVSGTAGAATQLIPSNPRRLALSIINLSNNVIFVGPRNDVTNTHGIWLAANGGSLTLTWDKDFALCAHDWYCISAAGGDACYIIEELSQ